jgi:hypothetical protein
MMKKWIFALAVLVLLSSCADFFTNSWGKNSVRDPSTLNVTASNVKDLLKEAKGDTKTSRGILDKIAAQLKNNPNPNPTLQAAAVTAANQAGGLGMTVLDSLKDLDVSNPTAFSTLLTGIQNKAKGNDLPGISDGIVDSLPVSNSGAPVFEGNFADNVTDSDLTLLTLTLVLAEAEKSNGFDNYIADWTSDAKKIDGSTGLSDSEKVIAAAVNELASRPNNDLGKMLKDLLGE